MNRKIAFVIFFFTGFVFGLIAGAFGIFTFVSYRNEQYYERIHQLSYEIREKDLHLAKLKEGTNKNRLLIKDAQVELVYQGELPDKTALEQAIKARIAILIGKEVKYADPDLIGEMIDRQLIQLHGRVYKLKLVKLLVGEMVKAWVEVKPVAGS
ncbi:Hypothetical protein LUCI_0397 [Lucifera butyrica]|uniref:Sporulation membrane protein YtrI C-terminal domain-containing protein n=1 Tax=Lucifera butyrica TaxID=1351585 RepID=A0A498R334_9FIRM|nr:hypothetical protein [Lucifera butyrica]VBB05190.1 Hypothetical protein LUCI_0397 [Lucifera butyrica]